MTQGIPPEKRILLMSSSRQGTMGYLEHAGKQIHHCLRHEKRTVVFIPFAAVSFSYDAYETKVKAVFGPLGYALESLHRQADARACIENAEAIAIGGGNTFALLDRLYTHDLIDVIRHKVQQGTPFIGWSAGSNVACPSIRTSNDMAIVEPPSLQALNLVPFQINPHFIGGKPVGHNGETREDRLAEYMILNAPQQVLALPEGTALYSDGTLGTILGMKPALVFSSNTPPRMLTNDEIFALDTLRGPSSLPEPAINPEDS